MLTDTLKVYLQYMLPKQALTHLAGRLAEVKTPFLKNAFIRWFIAKYHVNMQEAIAENPEDYATFNAFFIRPLKPSYRPIDEIDVISPIDGCISEIGAIHEGQLLQAKGQTYSLRALLAGDEAQSALFQSGKFATFYLSPKDYHRIHMPIAGTLKKMVYIPGALFSVQPATTRNIPNLFARNERVLAYFDTQIGPMVMVLVGATIVGSINTNWYGSMIRGHEITSWDYRAGGEAITLDKAAEMGYFKLGSTVILLFAEGQRLGWEPNLHAGRSIHFGEALARVSRQGE